MRFYTQNHQYYCGIDLHARSMYLCILNGQGEILLHRNFKTEPDAFLKAVAPYREDPVVAVECIFTWYWLADLCAREGIAFVLGHALYMKAIHGGKAKNDKIDAHKIAVLLRGGMLPQAYVYPQVMRATRDLLRRRNHLMRKRTDLLAHIQHTASQYNLPPLGTRVDRKGERAKIPAHFPDPVVRRSIELDLSLIAHYDQLLDKLEQELALMAKDHDAFAYHLLRSVPGVGRILTLVLLYEIEDIHRFPRVQEFLSYARLVKAQKSSAGKVLGYSGKKIGNVHLKWAFSEAAVLYLRQNPAGQRYLERLANKHGKGKALSILAAHLGRAVYTMLKRRVPFDPAKFLAHAA
jgi:transposase